MYITAVPSSAPHSFTIFIASAMVGIWLVGGADDASTLVEILSAAFFYLQTSVLVRTKEWALLILVFNTSGGPLVFPFS